MGKYNNTQGFTLVETMLSTLLLSMLCIVVWDLLGHCAFLEKQAEDRTDLYNGLRISLNRMSREIKYARSISPSSDSGVISFVNARGDNVSYYCLNNQLLRREKGSSAPLASHIESVSFSYISIEGLLIDRTNITVVKQTPGWAADLSMITVVLTAGKQGASAESVALTRALYLRALP